MNVCLCPDAQPRLRLREGIYSLSSHLNPFPPTTRGTRGPERHPHRQGIWRHAGSRPRHGSQPTSICRTCTVS